MKKEKKKDHGWLITLIVIVLLAAVCAAPFVYDRRTHFDYEDYAALASTVPERFHIAPAGDGERLLFHTDKADVYAMLLEEDVLAAVEEQTGGKVKIEQLGYTLRPEWHELEVRAAVKALGFLPAQLRALADVEVAGDELTVRPREVWYGDRIRIGPEKLAKWTGMPELTEGFTVSLKAYTEPLRADKVYLEGEGLTFSSPLLAQVIDDVAAAKEETELRLLRLYTRDDSAAARVLRGDGRADFINAAGASYEALSGALGDVCAYGSDEHRCALINELSAFPAADLTAGLREYPELRQAMVDRVAEAQATYAAAQLGLRTDYWYRNVTLAAGCPKGMEGTPLEDRLPADWEARVVLMYNEGYDAIVKTSEGNPRLQEPIPGLPMLSELPREQGVIAIP